MMKSRIKLFIYNAVVVLICLGVLISFFVAPFWQVKAKYTVTPEMLKETIEKVAGGGEGEDNPLGNLQLTDEDYDKVLGTEGFKVSLSLKLETMDMFSSLAFGKETETVENLLTANVNGVVAELVPRLNTLVKNAMPVISKVVINQAINDQVEKALEGTDGNAKELMEQAGFTNEYIDSETSKLVDAIYADDATVDSVAETVVETLEDVFTKLQESEIEQFAGAELTEESKEEIRGQVKEALSVMADNEGNIVADELVADLILRSLQQINGGESESGKARLPVLLAESSEEIGTTERLKAELSEMLMGYVNDSTVSSMVLAMRIVSGLILFTMFTWAYLILKILVKLLCKNPGIKLALPIWLGWLPFLLLVLFPQILLLIVNTSPGFLGSIIGEQAMATLTQQLSVLSIGFSSCTIVALIGAVALFVLFFFYRRPRNKLKKLKKLRRIYPNATEADVR